tara:strand:+ start:1740 stop:2375 length:636 start_codon:yes stop_codon:yes gene_type:complete
LPEDNKKVKSYLQIIRRRGIFSFFNEIIENFLFDIKYKTDTQLRVGRSRMIATHYAPSYYSPLKKIFSLIPNKKKLNFVDIGCGKGKVLLIASNFGFKNISGIDIDEKLLKICKKNISIYQKTKKTKVKINVKKINADLYNVDDDNVFYFFNPFSYIILNKILKKIKKNNKKETYIIYCAPQTNNYILNSHFKKIFTEHYNTHSFTLYKKF